MLSRKVDPDLINLALQGGGAHGAFTWGVLDAVARPAVIGAKQWINEQEFRRGH